MWHWCFAMFAVVASPAEDSGPARGDEIINRAVIIREAERPSVESSVVNIWLDFEVEARGGPRLIMYQLYEGEHVEIPQRGSECTIAFHRGQANGLRSREISDESQLFNIVDHLSCELP